MFIFGHIGITLGAAVAITGAIQTLRKESAIQETTEQPESGTTTSLTKSSRAAAVLSHWLGSLGRFMDIRLLVIGAMLPDIIDKPIGIFLFGDGRIFTHSLLVTCLILIAALYLYLKQQRTWLLALVAGMVCHLVLDLMWLSPDIFYWPVYGWNFPAGVIPNFFDYWLNILGHDPSVMISEGLGLIITIVILWSLVKERKFIPILFRGQL